MAFNEDSRVKIPTILHLCRLGYTYLSLNKAKWDEANNIFTEIFRDSISRIGLEVKSGAKQKAPGMEEFKRQHQPDKVLLVGNTGMPWKEFLKISPTQLF